MFTWTVRDGFDWQVLHQEVPESEPQQHHLLGVVVDYGTVDEPLTDLGSLRCAAAIVRSELMRPIELRSGGVDVPEVQVAVDSDSTTFTLSGNSEVLTSAWRRFRRVFADRSLDLDHQPLPVVPAPWPTDIAFRYGVSALALSAIDNVTIDLPAATERRLSDLNPSSGRHRAVFFTTDEQFVEQGFDQPNTPAPAPAPAPELSSVGGARGSLPAPNNELLFSTTVPSTMAGLVAAQLILARSRNTLHGLHQAGGMTRARLTGFRSERYLTIGNAAEDAIRDRHRTQTFLAQDLPAVSAEQLETEIVSASVNVDPGWARRSRLLGMPDEPATPSTVRIALQAAADAVHLARVGDDSVPEGFPALRPDLPEERGTIFHSWGQQRLMPGYSMSLTDAQIGPRTLATYHNLNDNGHKVRRRFQQVDLSDPALVIQDPAGMLTVVDRSLRTADLIPSGFRRSEKLRDLLDRRLSATPRLRVAETKINIAEQQQSLRRAKRNRVLAFVLPAALTLGLIAAAVGQQLSNDDPVDADTFVGDTVELSNGTEITVTRVGAVRDGRDATIRAHVRFCAGEDSRSDNSTPADVRRRVSPDDFSFYDGYSAGSRTAAENDLPTTTLATGTCAEGDLTFTVMNYQGHEDKVSYTNEAGDDVLWRG